MAITIPEKEDLCGLETLSNNSLKVTDNDTGTSASYLEKMGAKGQYVADAVFGTVNTPTTEYAVVKDATIAGEIGTVYGTAALRRVNVSTTAGQAPTVSAESVTIEAGAASTQCVFGFSVSVTPEYHAQNFGAFTYTESATLALQSCNYTVEATIDPKTVNGDPVASDAVGGKETITATFWSTTPSPSITTVTGWTLSSPLSASGADGDVYTITGTWTRHLAAD